MKPRVLLVPYLKNWSYDITARALAKHLATRFDIDIAYQSNTAEINTTEADIVVDFWWRGSLNKRYPGKVVKQISSHRWGLHKWGAMSAATMMRRHTRNIETIVVPSERLHRIVVAAAEPLANKRHVHVGAKGFEPRLFLDYGYRRGPMTAGWAGDATAEDKHVDVLRAAMPTLQVASKCLVQSEMGDFYNGLDVIAVASEAEGDPRPLIEGMASGCFPVTVDVGIVPELVRDGIDGLIVARDVGAFRRAFEWCAANIDYVRAAGRANAERMRATRTWAHVASGWGDIFDEAIVRARAWTERAPVPEPDHPLVSTSVARALARR